MRPANNSQLFPHGLRHSVSFGFWNTSCQVNGSRHVTLDVDANCGDLPAP
jgi:hypothetical protein